MLYYIPLRPRPCATDEQGALHTVTYRYVQVRALLGEQGVFLLREWDNTPAAPDTSMEASRYFSAVTHLARHWRCLKRPQRQQSVFAVRWLQCWCPCYVGYCGDTRCAVTSADPIRQLTHTVTYRYIPLPTVTSRPTCNGTAWLDLVRHLAHVEPGGAVGGPSPICREAPPRAARRVLAMGGVRGAGATRSSM